MEHTIYVAVVMHGIERLLTVLIGGLCMVLGWHLFSKNLDTSGQADISHAGWRMSLKRIGPGVFFALFGSFILITSLMQPIKGDVAPSPTPPANPHTAIATDQTPHAPGGSIVQMNSEGRNSALLIAHALNTAITVATMNRQSGGLSAELDDLKRSADRLTNLRDQIVANVLGTNLLKLWQKDGSEYKHDKSSLPLEERTQLDEVFKWMDEGVASESTP
jgi:hypothetical protein